MNSPEFSPVDASSANNRLHPGIPVEEPPYDEDTTHGLDPSIPIEERPYSEEADALPELVVQSTELPIEYVREPIIPIPHTFEGHCELLDAAIEKAIAGGYPNKPKVKVRGDNMSIPKYLATIVGGTKSGLTTEERRRINDLYIGPWTYSGEDVNGMGTESTVSSSVSKVAQSAIAGTAIGNTLPISDNRQAVQPESVIHPHVVTDFSEDDDPYERAKHLRAASWEERIAP